jgi:hypothetical protein
MSYSLIVQVEGPFPEYGDGTYDSEKEAIEAVSIAIDTGAYLSGNLIEVVNDTTGQVVFKTKV